jgi:hypothetical protein
MQLLLVGEQIKSICIIWLNVTVLTNGIHMVKRIHFFPSHQKENAQYDVPVLFPTSL